MPTTSAYHRTGNKARSLKCETKNGNKKYQSDRKSAIAIPLIIQVRILFIEIPFRAIWWHFQHKARHQEALRPYRSFPL